MLPIISFFFWYCLVSSLGFIVSVIFSFILSDVTFLCFFCVCVCFFGQNAVTDILAKERRDATPGTNEKLWKAMKPTAQTRYKKKEARVGESQKKYPYGGTKHHKFCSDADHPNTSPQQSPLNKSFFLFSTHENKQAATMGHFITRRRPWRKGSLRPWRRTHRSRTLHMPPCHQTAAAPATARPALAFVG